MNASAIEFHYIDLVFPLIRQLMEEALIIGIVVVAFGMLAKAAQDPANLLKSIFWQRLILLFAIMTWTSGIILTYELYKLELNASEEALTPAEAIAFSKLTLAMIPLELAMALMICIMFGALAFRDYRATESTPDYMRPEFTILFVVGILVHLIWAAWFIIVYGFTERLDFQMANLNIIQFFIQPGDVSPAHRSLATNISFHVSISATFVLALIAFRAFVRTRTYKSYAVGWDWLVTFGYAGFIVTYYINRVGDYLAAFHTKAPVN